MPVDRYRVTTRTRAKRTDTSASRRTPRLMREPTPERKERHTMSDELTNALAESGKLHGLAADVSGKLHSWSDALERGKRIIESRIGINASLDVTALWQTVDYIVCAMRDAEGEIDRALRIPTLAAGAVVDQSLDDFADEWEEGRAVIVANPYPVPESAQELALPAPNFYPSDGPRYRDLEKCPVLKTAHQYDDSGVCECGDTETIIAHAIDNHDFIDVSDTGEACQRCGHSSLHWIHDTTE